MAGRATPSFEKKNFSLGQKRASVLAPVEPLTEKITFELSVYVTAAMRQRSATERLSHRYYVLVGLRAVGFEVDEQDLIPDGRRLRSRRDC
jgi:hypothetical protein